MKLLPDAPKISSQDPLYNIGVVTRMTGISMATLRAWERRYDFPEAERTVGGHRLYSERDILRLRWVKERIDEGMQTAQAILALRHQESAGPRAADAPAARPATDPAQSSDTKKCLDMYQHQLADALVLGDLIEADRQLAEALASFTVDELILQVVGPTLVSLGDAWAEQRISVATEHLGTNFLRQRLLLWMASSPQPLSIPPVALACAPEEWHETGLLMLGVLLRRKRLPVIYLGQALPLADLALFVNEHQPALVVLASMTKDTAQKMLDWPAFLPDAAANGKPLVCFGGKIFTHDHDLLKAMPGVYLGDTFEDALQFITEHLTPAA